MAEAERKDPNALVMRVDELIREQLQARRADEAEVPVLTEIVDVRSDAPESRTINHKTLEALAQGLEEAMKERMGAELNRVIETRLAQVLNQLMDDVLENMRTELNAGMHQMVRDAVASVTRALDAGSAEPGKTGKPPPDAPD